MSFKEKLANMKENWNTAKDKASNTFSDGSYNFQLQNAEVTESQSSGKLMIHREHYCTEGEMAGEVLHDYIVLESEWGPVFAQQWIEKMGREVPEDPTDLEEIVNEIAEAAPTYTGVVKTKDGFTNLKITRMLEAETVKAVSKKPSKKPAKAAEEDDSDADDSDDEEADEKPVKGKKSKASDADDCPFKKKDKIKVKVDGYSYPGVVTGIDVDEHTVDVELNSGDEKTVDWDEVKEDDGEEDDEPKPTKGKKAKKPVVEEDNDEDEAEDLTDDLIAFAQSQDIKVSDKDNVKTLTKKINAFGWAKSELTKEEITLLKKIGATFE